MEMICLLWLQARVERVPCSGHDPPTEGLELLLCPGAEAPKPITAEAVQDRSRSCLLLGVTQCETALALLEACNPS